MQNTIETISEAALSDVTGGLGGFLGMISSALGGLGGGAAAGGGAPQAPAGEAAGGAAQGPAAGGGDITRGLLSSFGLGKAFGM